MATMAVRMAAASHEEASAIDTIVLAFSSDPVARWCWADPRLYLSAMPTFTRAFAGRAFVHQAAFCTDDFAGAALWIPPGVDVDEEAVVDVLQRTAPDGVRADLFAMFEQMGQYHPEGPHWYLPMIGVDPARQGRGYGSALLACSLALCDRDQVPAYLESTNPRNIPLYKRHGFEQVGTIQVGSSPPVVPMLRQAR